MHLTCGAGLFCKRFTKKHFNFENNGILLEEAPQGINTPSFQRKYWGVKRI